MNRIDRISAILIQLQSRRIVKASDIAERFDISLRTVYRDVKTLEEAGVPIIGEAGVGYSIMDGYRLPPVMFTKEEATAFLTAEKFIEKLTDSDTTSQYRSAMYKVKAVLRSADKNLLEDMDGNITVMKPRRSDPEQEERNALQPILNGIANKNVLGIDYFAMHSQTHSTRHVEPVGVFFSEGNWHLIAFCRLRNDYRDFRTDRIKMIYNTGIEFDQQHPTLKEYLKQVAHEQKLNTVIMNVDKKAISYIDSQKYYNGYVSQEDMGDTVQMTFLTLSIEGFARWYMMFGDYARIIGPQHLKDRIRQLYDKMLSNITEENSVTV
ncbi:helix-turn-helix transcriptional regulator [Mucilaginibacter myungsuensis]|uniref:YafY family transcriptional regulator n=1 Tax=Mucilaginibacter myungsuensis TaxID=649104 RepID=A0A929KTT4_9SPHI|nr:YafY family protein [Mucilaginibacter myungsuensis]MBE9660283.1 YafY family transcriptional regulator [Mucilaginibacter myungsuensis]MDN3600325.1 YafY family protein [Mucilaginibacter myungsuensis]